MELRGLLPLVVALIVGFVLLRLVLGAIKTSAKLMVWAVVAAALFGLGYLWMENQGMEGGGSLPSLSIPSYEDSERR